MNLLGISINHQTAPVELREAVHLSDEEIRAIIQKLKGNFFSEGLIISTCNRTEIYGIPAKTGLTHIDVENFLVQQKLSSNQFNHDHFQTFTARSAVDHLFHVITGIDSLLIGDNQIFKQVKDSFQIAEDEQFSGVLLKRVFDYATKAGKRAITETEISDGAVTVSFAAVQLIEKIFSNLSKKSALVIGAGDTGEIAAKHLRDRGIGRLTITNRTLEKAEKLAQSLQAKIVPFTNFKQSLHEYDIILSATSSPDLLLVREDIVNTMKKRNYESLVLMDIAIPRDIDQRVKSIDYVFYNDIDSLNIIVEQNLAKRRDEIPKVKSIIEQEVNAFFSWYNGLEAAPTIKNLRDYFESVRAEEVDKNKNRFSAEDQEKLDIVTKRIINKILHNPTVELKKYADAGTPQEEAAARISIIRELFGIDRNRGEEKKS
ncbi:MAG: glutamyl-tRNA reductase [Ignavibacteriaceae bacterium]